MKLAAMPLLGPEEGCGVENLPLLAESDFDGKLDQDALIARRIGLERINEGFEDLRQGRAIRSVMQFEDVPA